MCPFEKLDRAFVLFSPFPRIEGAQVSALPGFGINLPGIQPVFSGFESSNHVLYGAGKAPRGKG
jgi:hypothetical protein